ncbi:MAG TPA: methyltransferase domain-containing protein [Stackebrandtia sp.]|uniref:class I SAM-dependent methyltransferase n=1 Tax=Stackebrandtia sp. TaxID=2023065 RepID=UPI002D701227|nr:methyltransferase domain-containing protein [Stackebrandtia sp.]HZE41933.1 methyltransferase domain-containing protein [Stackebrandtia sp.]
MTTLELSADSDVHCPPAAWRADAYSAAMRTGRGPLFLRRDDGWLLPLEVERWCARADATDNDVLSRCPDSVIDIGCGPGRIVAALRGRPHRALGVDLNPAAVDRTRRRGAEALCASVFDPLPDEGAWSTALLLDGNIGIGGDPGLLLKRMAQVLRPKGNLIVEVCPTDVDERVVVAFTDGRGVTGTAFDWARVGSRALRRLASPCGWAPVEDWTHGRRRFVRLASAS